MFFKGRANERASFARIALSMRRVEMAAIAAAAELRLAPGPDADAFADKVVELALEDAEEALATGDTAREAASLRAADLAARGRSPKRGRSESTGTSDGRLHDKIDRDPLEFEVIRKQIGSGSMPASALIATFRKAVALEAHSVAGLAAEAAVDAGMGGKIDRELLTYLTSQSRQMIEENNPLAAASYFLPLFRVAPEVESVAILRPRVVRLIVAALDEAELSTAYATTLTESLERLDAANPILLRSRALAVARRGDADEARQRLDVWAAASPSGWKNILSEARSAFKADDIRYGMVLYDWLASRGHAGSEAKNARVRAFRARVRALSEIAKENDAEVDKAASAVLEIEPENARALWIKVRALLRLRRGAEALATLRLLVQVSPEYPGAADLLQRQEKKGSARGAA